MALHDALHAYASHLADIAFKSGEPVDFNRFIRRVAILYSSLRRESGSSVAAIDRSVETFYRAFPNAKNWDPETFLRQAIAWTMKNAYVDDDDKEVMEKLLAAFRGFLLGDGSYSGCKVITKLSETSVYVAGEQVQLTKIEFQLFSYLSLKIGEVVSIEDFIYALEIEGEDQEGSISKHVRNMRRKLEPHLLRVGYKIETIRGVGFMFTELIFNEA